MKLHWNVSRPLCTIHVPRDGVFDAADNPTFRVELHYGNIQFINVAQYQTWPHFSDYRKKPTRWGSSRGKNDFKHNCTQKAFGLIAISIRPHTVKNVVRSRRKPLYCDCNCCWVWVHIPLDTCAVSLMFLTQLDGLSASHLAICIQVLITPSSAFAQCKALEGFFLTSLYFLKAIRNYTCVLTVKMTKSFLRKVRCDFDKFTKNLFGVASEYQFFHSRHMSNCTLWLLQPRTFFTACFIIQEVEDILLLSVTLWIKSHKALVNEIAVSQGQWFTSIIWSLIVCSLS